MFVNGSMESLVLSFLVHFTSSLLFSYFIFIEFKNVFLKIHYITKPAIVSLLKCLIFLFNMEHYTDSL